MISDRILRPLLRTDSSLALWGDVIRGAIAFGVSGVCTLFVIWYGFVVRMAFEALSMNDFGKFYYAARLYLAGGDMYAATSATLIPAGARAVQLWDLNPPHFHLLVLPLAPLAPLTAFAVWSLVNVGALAVAAGMVQRELRVRLTAARALWGAGALLAFAGTGAVLVTGQFAWLLLLVVTLAWVNARHGRWQAAAVWIGLGMSVKPFLGIFLPWFLMRRRPGAAGTAIAVVGGCFAVGTLVFGSGAHAAWLRVMQDVSWHWEPMNGAMMGALTRTLGDNPLFQPVLAAPRAIPWLWWPGVAVIAAATMVVLARDRTAGSVDRAFFLLPLAAMLISPLGWVYNLWLPLPPAAALIVSRARAIPPQPPRLAWHYRVALLAVPAIVWPLPATLAAQPSGWATLTMGSMYFWGTLALWVAGLEEIRRCGRRPKATPDRQEAGSIGKHVDS